MSTHALQAPGAVTPPSPTEEDSPPGGISVRRWALVASPVLAGLFAVVGAAADPAVAESGQVLFEKYAANPEPLQIKSLSLHYSYAFWILPAIMLAGYVRGRGLWIANVAAVIGWVGISTLPGLLMADFYDSAIGQVAGPETTARVADLIGETMWGAKAFVLPGLIGFALALPLATVAAARARVLSWWSPVLAVAGLVAFTLSNVTWWGCLIVTALFTLLAVDIARGTSGARNGSATTGRS